MDTKLKYLLVLFLVTILVRTPNLNRPVSKHHEFNTAFFLIPMEIWAKDGITTHSFMPPYNYSNPNDKDLLIPIGIESGVKNGTSYYLSLPVLSYVVPYAVFQVFSLEISPLNLQIFNLFTELLIVIVLFQLLTFLFSNKAAFFALLFYLFAPGTLWFFGNGYNHHVFSLLFVVVTIYYWIRYLHTEKSSYYYFFLLALFLLFWTEWIAVFLAAILFFIALFNFKQNKTYRLTLFGVMIVGLTAISLIIAHYSIGIGWENYTDYLNNRFVHRTGIEGSENPLIDLLSWFKWTFVSYGIWIVFIVLVFTLIRFKKIKIWDSFKDKFTKHVFVLFVIPPFLYHIFFNNFLSSHDYSVLIDSFFWAFLIAFSYAVLHQEKVQQLLFSKLAFTLIICCSLLHYYAINRPGEVNQNGDHYAIYQNIGDTIRKTIQADETVFMTGFDETSISKNNPQIIYYAKRNYEPVANIEEAKKFLVENQRRKGKVYVISNHRISKVISLENPID